MDLTSSSLCTTGTSFLSQESVKPASPISDQEIEFEDGDKYIGGVVDGQMQGYGELTYTDGCVIKGDWIAHELPFGIIIFPDGSTYKGEIRNLVPHGNGHMLCYDGITTYEGVWDSGNIVNGKCCCDKQTYEGQFKNNLYHGIGTLIIRDIILQGKWVEGKLRIGSRMEGKNNYYIGQFKDLKADGFGTLYFEMNISDIEPDHIRNQYRYQVFSGKWTEGKLSSGTVKGDGRLIYQGALKDDMFHGFGTYYYPDGKIVRGTFQEDILITADGDIDKVPLDYLEEKMSASHIETSSRVQQKKRKRFDSNSSSTMRTVKRLVIEKSTLE